MKKKLLTMVLAGAMAVSMMAGCGSSSSSGDSAGSDASASTDAASGDSATASGDFDAFHDHDVPAELPELPCRYHGSGPD